MSGHFYLFHKGDLKLYFFTSGYAGNIYFNIYCIFI